MMCNIYKVFLLHALVFWISIIRISKRLTVSRQSMVVGPLISDLCDYKLYIKM